MSGSKVLEALQTSWGLKARFAADSEWEMEEEEGEVMM